MNYLWPGFDWFGSKCLRFVDVFQWDAETHQSSKTLATDIHFSRGLEIQNRALESEWLKARCDINRWSNWAHLFSDIWGDCLWDL